MLALNSISNPPGTRSTDDVAHIGGTGSMYTILARHQFSPRRFAGLTAAMRQISVSVNPASDSCGT